MIVLVAEQWALTSNGIGQANTAVMRKHGKRSEASLALLDNNCANPSSDVTPSWPRRLKRLLCHRHGGVRPSNQWGLDAPTKKGGAWGMMMVSETASQGFSLLYLPPPWEWEQQTN
jgi:hypothetical protein